MAEHNSIFNGNNLPHFVLHRALFFTSETFYTIMVLHSLVCCIMLSDVHQLKLSFAYSFSRKMKFCLQTLNQVDAAMIYVKVK